MVASHPTLLALQRNMIGLAHSTPAAVGLATDGDPSRASMWGTAYESEQCAPAIVVQNVRRGGDFRPRG